MNSMSSTFNISDLCKYYPNEKAQLRTIDSKEGELDVEHHSGLSQEQTPGQSCISTLEPICSTSEPNRLTLCGTLLTILHSSITALKE